MNDGRILAALALAAAATAMACGHDGREAAGAVAPVRVRVARVGGGGGGWVEVPGIVEAARTAEIASRVSAVVEVVRVEEGAHVHGGDLLIRLDGREVRARLAAAEAALRTAQARRDRIETLFARDAATRQEKETAEGDYETARAARDAAQVSTDDVELRAPFDGDVIDRRISVGDLVTPGRPLLTVQGAGRLRVAASVTRAQADRLEPGDPIDAVLEGGAVVRGRVSVLAPGGDPSSLRVSIKADLPRDAGARAGSFARLRLAGSDEEAIPLVPRAALVERGALTGVYVVESGRARLRWISPGESSGGDVVVRAGLSAGEQVVLHPSIDLAEGAVVEPLP